MARMSHGAAGSTNNVLDDVTFTFNGTGPGTTSFTWGNLANILWQAFAAAHDKADNITLLPKNFVFHSYLTKSFRTVQRLCLRQGPNYEEEICRQEWRLLLGTGQSGSKYFLSANEDFIIKTVPLKEHTCLTEILPRLCQILTDNPRTLLPRFFGLYSYEGGGKTIRFMVMNNILPTDLHIDKRFDLKGATRRKTASNVYKDDAFMKTYPSGFEMDEAYINVLRELFELDCMHLREMGLTSYSLFIAVHEVDKDDDDENGRITDGNIDGHVISPQSLGYLQYRNLGIPAELSGVGKVLLNIGIIHTLKPYTLSKKQEHFFKSLTPGGSDTPVQPPREFEERFTKYVRDVWFKPKRRTKHTDVTKNVKE